MVVQDGGVWLAVLLLGSNCMKFLSSWVGFCLFYCKVKVWVDKWSMYKLHPVYFQLG